MRESWFTRNTVVVLVLISFSFLIFWYFVQSGPKRAASQEELIIMEPPTQQLSPDEREYKNMLFRFSLRYPHELQVREYDDGTSASTITFENSNKTKGFQIFIVPYAEDYITAEQFKKDVPSGVFQDPTDIIIAGTRATMFFSHDLRMGPTREVWFIKNGFLYEVTARKELDEWFAALMHTWTFF